MSHAGLQLDFLPSLDFPGRQTVLVTEIAERLGLSPRHLYELIDEGRLVVLDAKTEGSSRRCARVPIECYRAFILGLLTGSVDGRGALLRTLPKATLRELRRDIDALLALAA